VGVSVRAWRAGGRQRQRVRLLAVVLFAVLLGLVAGAMFRTTERWTVIGVDLTVSPGSSQRLASAARLARKERARMLLVGVTPEQLLSRAALAGGSQGTGTIPPQASRAPRPMLREGAQPPETLARTDLSGLNVALVAGADGLRSALDVLGGVRERVGDGMLVVRLRRDTFNQPLALLTALLVMGVVLFSVSRRRSGAMPSRGPALSVGPPVADPSAPRPGKPGSAASAPPDPYASQPRDPDDAAMAEPYSRATRHPPEPARTLPARAAAVHAPRHGPVDRGEAAGPLWRRTVVVGNGAVRTPLAPAGYVEVQGVLLWALADPPPDQPPPPGTPIQVVQDRDGRYLARQLAPAQAGAVTPPPPYDTRERGPV
jgi:hypothetical protein